MEPKPNFRRDPEAVVKRRLKKIMEDRQWLVVVTHGNQFQAGLPDLYCAHRNHGTRWVEIKHAGRYHFTKDQIRLFPQMAAKGVGIWVLAAHEDATDAELEVEYKKLDLPPNWTVYLGHSKKPF